jgi:tetrahydromethanopterin S-methyltransferase subunit G
MKDKDNVLRTLDEADNMLAILMELAMKQAIDTNEAVRRLREIRRKVQFVNERVNIS